MSECLDCHRPMRGSRERATEKPGTVPASGRGLCHGCYRRRKRTNQPLTKQEVDNLAYNQRTLAHYLEWRRPYRKVMS